MSDSHFPTQIEHLLDGEFFAILTPESTTIPGDERSRIDYWKIQTFSSQVTTTVVMN